MMCIQPMELASRFLLSFVMPDDPMYIRFLNVLNAVRELAPFDAMTAEEDELLRSLLVRWHDASEISVGEVMDSMIGVSPATAYRRVARLRDQGLIYFRVDQADKRVKFVEPTAAALKYVGHIHEALQALVNRRVPD